MESTSKEMPSRYKYFVPQKDQNRFEQHFSYPPTEEDKQTYNRINTTENMFTCGRMIPTGHMVNKCECGNTFSQLVMESNKPIIHHSRPSYDSRDGPLSTYMLATGNCEHVKGGIQKMESWKNLQQKTHPPPPPHPGLSSLSKNLFWGKFTAMLGNFSLFLEI